MKRTWLVLGGIVVLWVGGGVMDYRRKQPETPLPDAQGRRPNRQMKAG